MQTDKPGIILFTEHYDACVRFYRDLFGLATIFELDSLVCLEFGGAYLMIESGGIAKLGEKSRAENPTVIRFNVADVAVAAVELRSKGVEVSVERYDWGIIGVFHDPDGNRCELKDPWDLAAVQTDD